MPRTKLPTFEGLWRFAVIFLFLTAGCRYGYDSVCNLDSDCDDGDPCTDDSCLLSGSCRYEYNTAACDDGDACSSLDRCRLGACVGGETDKDSDLDEHLDGDCAGGDDCDDSRADVHPGQDETLALGGCQDLLDNDCDGRTDGDDPGCRACLTDQDCDDGLYCNGADGCDRDGECTLHFGDPCGGLTCDEDADTCIDESWQGLGGSDFGPWNETINGSSWGGGVSSNAGWSREPVVALDDSGNPVLVWVDHLTGFSDIYVKRFDGNAWVEVGAGSAMGEGISQNDGSSYAIALDLDDAGNPVVAWQDSSSGSSEIYIKRYDGTNWVDIGAGSSVGGGISSNADDSGGPSMVLDASDNPIVAWHDRVSGNYEIYIKRYDGSSWVEIGTGSAQGGGISSNAGFSRTPSMALDGSGDPVVAWADETSGSYEIFVKRYDGNAWVEVTAGSASGGGISLNAGHSYYPVLALDGADRPVVVWDDQTSGNREIYIKRYDGNDWVEVTAGSASGGGISQSTVTSGHPVLALDPSDNPVVAWEEGESNDREVYIVRFDGNAWVEVSPGSASGGGVSANSGESNYPTLALDTAGNPVVAWEDYTSGVISEIYLKKFDGSSWVEVGGDPAPDCGISSNAGDSYFPSLALDGSGNPVLSWHDFTTGDGEIYTKRYNGSAWVDLGTDSSSGGGISMNPEMSWRSSLALTDSGNPVVAWQNDTAAGDPEIYLKRFDGDSWVEVGAGSATGGGISDNSDYSGDPSVAIDDSGNPVVAWSDGAPANTEIFIKRYDGNAWVEIGAGSAEGGGISMNAGDSGSPSLALDTAGNPVVAWQDSSTGNQEIYIKRYDGSSWVDIGAGSSSGMGISSDSQISSNPSLALDGSDKPIVVWNDYSQEPMILHIFVKRYDGNAWVEVGAGSASGDGISEDDVTSYFPSLALDESDNPVVAWSGISSGMMQIYLKRFDGSQWVELGTNSASGGGISNSGAMSSYSSVAIGGGKICVAWNEAGGTSLEVVLRCAEAP